MPSQTFRHHMPVQYTHCMSQIHQESRWESVMGVHMSEVVKSESKWSDKD